MLLDGVDSFGCLVAEMTPREQARKRAVAEDWHNEIRLMKVKAGKPKPQYFRLLYADNGSDGLVRAFALLRGARFRELCCIAACSQDQTVLVDPELFQWHPVLDSLHGTYPDL